ncbi:unnamed protein product, partial [Mesorhabditis belari]|uniref:Uncharacterized protein n=1 Tax=Mesorhabditis belari TaxID=2138241 RepID=A0AAF3ESA4_9BILA
MRSVRGRLLLKCLQFISSLLLIVILSKLGTQWILLLGSLLVPPFGIYMIVKSPDRQKHLLPYQTYMAVAAGRRWLRVDAILCASMFIAFAGFALILFISANQTIYPLEARLLSLSGLCAVISAIAYALNALLSVFHLRIGTIDFSHSMINHAKLSNSMKLSSAPVGQTPLPLHIDTLDRFHQSPLPFPDETLVRSKKAQSLNKSQDWELPSYFQIVSIPRVQSLANKERSVVESWSNGRKVNNYEDCRHFGINMVPSEGSPEPFQVYDVPAETSTPKIKIRRFSSHPKIEFGKKSVEFQELTRINVSAEPERPVYSSKQPTVSTLVSVNDYSTLPTAASTRIRVQTPKSSKLSPILSKDGEIDELSPKNEQENEKILDLELVCDV